MHLYMESQVRDAAHVKYGGDEGIQERAKAILDRKLQDRVRVSWSAECI